MEILLIEDNPDHAFLCEEAIQNAWPETTLHTVHTVSAAQALITHQDSPDRFDMILAALDQHPHETLADVRELQASLPVETRPIPLILLVNSTRERQLAQVANHPHEWILLKPLQVSSLHAILVPNESK
jgi:CheY-like chemotaxis protein